MSQLGKKKASNSISTYIWLRGISLVTENLLSLKDKMSDSKRKETHSVQIHTHSPTGEMISLSEYEEFYSWRLAVKTAKQWEETHP